MTEAPTERVHKRLATLGVGSRRTVEEWVRQGKVRVDGRVARCGERVGAHSRITVDGRPIAAPRPQRARVILYHKPEGEISTRRDHGGRPTVFHRLPPLRGQRWVAVGRLDINSRGLLLFTTDGAIAHGLMHPRFGAEREYLCRVYGEVTPEALRRLQRGIRLDGTLLRFRQVQRRGGGARNRWYSVVVGEGKYREVRRMWEAVGVRVSRLIRIRYGDITLPTTLKPGRWQELEAAEVAALLGTARRSDAVK